MEYVLNTATDNRNADIGVDPKSPERIKNELETQGDPKVTAVIDRYINMIDKLKYNEYTCPKVTY
jgi:hypothetical protein